MKHIFNILSKLFVREQPTLLGRWKLEYTVYKLDRKIDLANKDYCYGYYQYTIHKHKQIKQENK